MVQLDEEQMRRVQEIIEELSDIFACAKTEKKGDEGKRALYHRITQEHIRSGNYSPTFLWMKLLEEGLTGKEIETFGSEPYREEE
jgi:hypothetical protein